MWTVHAFYRFVSLPDFRELRDELRVCCREAGLVGSILLAHEGINATIAGSDEGLMLFWGRLRQDVRFSGMMPKVSRTDRQPFKRMKVRLKKEIVTMGVPDIDPIHEVGKYVDPLAWNELIRSPDVLVIDTRNQYEVAEGRFEGAVDPETASFREFPAYVEKNLNPNGQSRIATYCTGGIRCEKATAFLRKRGFSEVYHLRGGILNYLEKVPPEESLWKGTCFVFDERGTLDHDLQSALSDADA